MKCHLAYYRGPRSHAWKGGRYLNGAGYVMVWDPGHPRAGRNGYVREHIKVWMDAQGLPEGFNVHHLNGIRDDNRLENLAAVPRADNRSWHLLRLLQSRIRSLEG